MRKRAWLYCIALLAVVVLLAGLVALPTGTAQALSGSPMLRWLTGGGSGGGTATGGGYTLSDSLGQSLSGPSSGGGYRINSGYQVDQQASSARLFFYLPVIYRTNP